MIHWEIFHETITTTTTTIYNCWNDPGWQYVASVALEHNLKTFTVATADGSMLWSLEALDGTSAPAQVQLLQPTSQYTTHKLLKRLAICSNIRMTTTALQDVWCSCFLLPAHNTFSHHSCCSSWQKHEKINLLSLSKSKIHIRNYKKIARRI